MDEHQNELESPPLDLTFQEALERLNQELPFEAMSNITCTDSAMSGPDLMATPPARFSTFPTREWTVTILHENFAGTQRSPSLRMALEQVLEKLRSYEETGGFSSKKEKPPKLVAPSSAAQRDEPRQKEAS